MKFKVSVDIECGESWDFEVDRAKLKPELRELSAVVIAERMRAGMLASDGAFETDLKRKFAGDYLDYFHVSSVHVWVVEDDKNE